MYERIAGALVQSCVCTYAVRSVGLCKVISRVTCTVTTFAELEWQGSDPLQEHTQKCSESLLKTLHTFR